MIDVNENFEFVDTPLYKAQNVLITQLGTLHYAPEFGVDIDLFVSSDVEIQNETFRTHIIEQMINNNVVLNSFDTESTKFIDNYLMTIGE